MQENNPSYQAAIAYCLEHELPTTAGDAGEEGPENNPSTEVFCFMAGWEKCYLWMQINCGDGKFKVEWDE